MASNQQYRLGCDPHDALGYAAEYETANATPAVATDYDEIRRPLNSFCLNCIVDMFAGRLDDV